MDLPELANSTVGQARADFPATHGDLCRDLQRGGGLVNTESCNGAQLGHVLPAQVDAGPCLRGVIDGSANGGWPVLDPFALHRLLQTHPEACACAPDSVEAHAAQPSDLANALLPGTLR